MNNFLIIIIIVLIGCSNKQKNQTENVSTIRYSSYGFTFDKNDRIEIKNTIEIAFYKDFILYETNFILNKKNDNSANAYLDSTKENNRNKYYIVKKGDSIGLVFQNKTKFKKFNFKKFEITNGLNFNDYDFFSLDLGKPDLVQRDVITNEIEIEKFANKIKGKTEPDSLYRYYSKSLKDVDFSFSPNFDQKSKSKLYKIGLVYHLNEENSNNTKREESFYMFEKFNSNNKKLFLELFKIFENEMSNN